jgi:hypothetical protein
MTVIEIRPYRNGWKVFEAPGVEPVFPTDGFTVANSRCLNVLKKIFPCPESNFDLVADRVMEFTFPR